MNLVIYKVLSSEINLNIEKLESNKDGFLFKTRFLPASIQSQKDGIKKKIGYKKFEHLLADAHKKLDMLANKYSELQTYFIAYVEYNKDNVKFNSWMNDKLKEMKDELQKNEQANEPHLEGSTAD